MGKRKRKLKIGQEMVNLLIDVEGFKIGMFKIEDIQNDIIFFKNEVHPMGSKEFDINNLDVIYKVLVTEPYPHYEFGMVTHIKDLVESSKKLVEDEFNKTNQNMIELLKKQHYGVHNGTN